MSEKRRGLGRGLGALIPSGTPAGRTGADRPVDVFFPDRGDAAADGDAAVPAPTATATATIEREPAVTLPPPSEPPVSESAAPTPTVSPAPPVEEITTPAQPAEAGGPDLVPVPGARFAELPVTSIRPNPRQPRQVFDPDALNELVHSVREIGVLQPVVVRAIGDEDGEARYELIMGERRWRATQAAGLDRIPAIIRETSDDAMLRDALLENLHRSELNPLEEAAAYQQLLEDFGCTHDELAARIGRSRPQISNTIRLLRLPPLVQRRVAAGVLSAGHARALLGLEDGAAMERLAQRIVAEGLSVRATEEIVQLGTGEAERKPVRRPRPGSHHGRLDDLASRLGDHLDTKVSISLGRNKGRLGIDFGSVEDLNRILGVMAPSLRGLFQEGD